MTVEVDMEFDEDFHWATYQVCKWRLGLEDTTYSVRICIEKKKLELDYGRNFSWRTKDKLSNDLCFVPSWWSFAHNGSEQARNSGYTIDAQYDDDLNRYQYSNIRNINDYLRAPGGKTTVIHPKYDPSWIAPSPLNNNGGIHPPYGNQYIRTPYVPGTFQSGKGKP